LLLLGVLVTKPLMILMQLKAIGTLTPNAYDEYDLMQN
jgi:hypothetical protein